MKARIIVVDPPWKFGDNLTMSSTKRGAKSNYKNTMPTSEIKTLDVKSLAQKDAVLALWVPGTHLQEGLDVMKAWGFDQKQVFVWVKIKKVPLKKYASEYIKKFKAHEKKHINKNPFKLIWGEVRVVFNQVTFDANSILSFGMGHMFRQTHEICLIGTRGKITSKIKNKSQRSVHMESIGKHSEKPEALQDMLEKMWGKRCNKIELFARRDRSGWVCVGNECPSSKGEDIRDSIRRLRKQ